MTYKCRLFSVVSGTAVYIYNAPVLRAILEVSHFELWVTPVLGSVDVSLRLVNRIQNTSHWILSTMIGLRHVTFLMLPSMPYDTHDAH